MTSQSASIAIDSTKERDNVLVVLDAIVLVATVPPSEAYRVSASDFGRDFPHPHWVIPIDQIQRVEGGESNLRVKFTSDNGQDESVQFLTTAEKVSDCLAALQRGRSSFWTVQQRRSPDFRGVLVCGGVAAAVAGLTAIFYFGIQAGAIQTAPSFVALIYNTLGLGGILAAGGLLTLLFLCMAIWKMLVPATTVVLSRG